MGTTIDAISTVGQESLDTAGETSDDFSGLTYSKYGDFTESTDDQIADDQPPKSGLLCPQPVFTDDQCEGPEHTRFSEDLFATPEAQCFMHTKLTDDKFDSFAHLEHAKLTDDQSAKPDDQFAEDQSAKPGLRCPQPKFTDDLREGPEHARISEDQFATPEAQCFTYANFTGDRSDSFAHPEWPWSKQPQEVAFGGPSTDQFAKSGLPCPQPMFTDDQCEGPKHTNFTDDQFAMPEAPRFTLSKLTDDKSDQVADSECAKLTEDQFAKPGQVQDPNQLHDQSAMPEDQLATPEAQCFKHTKYTDDRSNLSSHAGYAKLTEDQSAKPGQEEATSVEPVACEAQDVANLSRSAVATPPKCRRKRKGKGK